MRAKLKSRKMEKILKRAKLQGALGAICILAAGATYFINGEPEFLKVVRILARLLAFVFLYYAIANVQRLSGSNVFTIFKYTYNAVLLALLCGIALYVIDKSFLGLIDIGISFLLLGVAIMWIIINFKLRADTGCVFFAVYAALLATKVAVNFLHGMLGVLTPALITSGIVKCIGVANALSEIVLPAVLLAAWLGIKSSRSSQDPWR